MLLLLGLANRHFRPRRLQQGVSQAELEFGQAKVWPGLVHVIKSWPVAAPTSERRMGGERCSRINKFYGRKKAKCDDLDKRR